MHHPAIMPRSNVTLAFVAVLAAVVLAGCSGNTKRLSEARTQVRGVCISQLGAPYRYGGHARTGFDAGGLVHFCYREAGYEIPTYPEGQLRAGQPIEYSAIERGDILFFRLRQQALGGDERLHSGVYVGDAKMIHSSADRDEVVSDPINTSYWEERLVAVVKILP